MDFGMRTVMIGSSARGARVFLIAIFRRIDRPLVVMTAVHTGMIMLDIHATVEATSVRGATSTRKNPGTAMILETIRGARNTGIVRTTPIAGIARVMQIIIIRAALSFNFLVTRAPLPQGSVDTAVIYFCE